MTHFDNKKYTYMTDCANAIGYVSVTDMPALAAYLMHQIDQHDGSFLISKIKTILEKR